MVENMTFKNLTLTKSSKTPMQGALMNGDIGSLQNSAARHLAMQQLGSWNPLTKFCGSMANCSLVLLKVTFYF